MSKKANTDQLKWRKFLQLMKALSRTKFVSSYYYISPQAYQVACNLFRQFRKDGFPPPNRYSGPSASLNGSGGVNAYFGRAVGPGVAVRVCSKGTVESYFYPYCKPPKAKKS